MGIFFFFFAECIDNNCDDCPTDVGVCDLCFPEFELTEDKKCGEEFCENCDGDYTVCNSWADKTIIDEGTGVCHDKQFLYLNAPYIDIRHS